MRSRDHDVPLDETLWDEAPRVIAGLAREGRVVFGRRAVETKMRPFGITEEDVIHCLTNPMAVEPTESGGALSAWHVTGLDLSGFALSVRVVIDWDILRVTC